MADDDHPLGPLAGILGLRVRLAHGAIQRHFAEHCGDIGLTQKQISVLWLVADTPGIAQTDIARRLEMDRATTMTLVHSLEKRGLVRRARADSDARRIALDATASGQQALASARSATIAHEQWLTARFTDGELAMLRDLLGRIHD